MGELEDTLPLWSTKGTTPLQKPRYKLDTNLNYVEETCQPPADYYDKCNSKPCTRCTPEQKCTGPTKRQFDPAKCVRRKHYIREPSLYGFEGDPWYGWSTIGEKKPKDEEGPFSGVIMQPYGYPNASVIVLLNDTKSDNFPSPTALSGLERLNKFPNQRGILLPDSPEDKQRECAAIGCPSFGTPGSFNPTTGRYTPKRYFPPHYHNMHSFLEKKALETGSKDLDCTCDTCFKYPGDTEYVAKGQMDAFGICQGPCGDPHKYKDIGKYQNIDSSAKSEFVPSERKTETEAESEEIVIEGDKDETDIRPGLVVIEHGISRSSCCFDESVSSLSGSEDGSLLSGETATEKHSRSGKEKRRISWNEGLGERESDESVHRHFRTMLFSIDVESMRKRDALIAKQKNEYVPHRRCTWRTMHDVVDTKNMGHKCCPGSQEAHHVSRDILNQLLPSEGKGRPNFEKKEAPPVNKEIFDGLLGLDAAVNVNTDFESHEPPEGNRKDRESNKNKSGDKDRGSGKSKGKKKK